MVAVQRHVALLRGLLHPGEQERLWLRAERAPQGQAGALLLTDRRLLFSGIAFVQQAQHAWPLAAVRDAALAPGRPAVLACTVLGLPERFAGREADLRRLADALGRAAGGTASAGLVAGLERLAALRDAGALTPAEFEGAKARLLE